MSNKPSLLHVAIIMDGNGRWARRRSLPRTAGHRQGIRATREIITACGEAGIKYLTLFAFSSENWKRPKAEISALMKLFTQSLESEIQRLDEKGVRFKFMGHRNAFSEELCRQIRLAEELTCKNDALFLNIAAGYGGRWDILRAVKDTVEDVLHEGLAPDDISEEYFGKRLVTGDMPAPDLFIRTGGEQRLSNFLLWQLAYTELYFCDTLWPDFSRDELNRAFESYRARQRRFGLTQEQLA